ARGSTWCGWWRSRPTTKRRCASSSSRTGSACARTGRGSLDREGAAGAEGRMAVGAMSTEVERFAGADYEVEVRPLKTGGRRDVAVHSTPPPVTSVDEVTPALRRFFADVDDELRKREGDP